MTSIPMTCQQFVEVITAYLDHELAPEEAAEFDAHLVECPYCQEYLDQMRRTVELSGRLFETSVDPEVREDFLACFREWTGQSNDPPRKYPIV